MSIDVELFTKGIEDIKVWSASVDDVGEDGEDVSSEDTNSEGGISKDELEGALHERIEVDEGIIHGVNIDIAKVDFDKEGTYDVVCTFVVHMPSLEEMIDGYEATLTTLAKMDDENACDDDITIEATFTCEIMGTEAIAKAYDEGEMDIIGAIENGEMTKAFEVAYNEMNEDEEEEALVVNEDNKEDEVVSASTPTPTTTPTPTPTQVHEHTWVTNTIHHEEQGHYESKVVGSEQVLVGYTKEFAYYYCTTPGCSFTTLSYDEMDNHEWETEHGGTGTKVENIPMYETRDVVEDQWVVDTPAWDEVITTCSGCGATQ